MALGAALAVLGLGFTPGLPIAASAAANRTGPAPCTPADGRPSAAEADAIATQSDAAVRPSRRSVAGGQAIGVTVPEGRLYLDPAHITIRVPAGSDEIDVAGLLLGDLRDDQPGWELGMTVTSLRGEGAELAAPITVEPTRPRPIVARGSARPGAPAKIGVGGCVVLSSAPSGHGWGTFRQSVHIEVPSGHGDLVIQVHLHLVSAS